MLPSLSTAIVMFSGLVCVGMLTAFGSCTGTVLVITGMVIRKMMSSTSITSTSGVVLMLAIAPPSSPPTFIAIFRSSRAAPQATNRGAPRHPGLHLARPLTCERCLLRRLLADRRCLGRSRAHPADRGATVHAGAAHQVGVEVARKVP